MAYKTMLTVITREADVADVLGVALPVARAEGAHLDILCVGVDHVVTGYYYAGAGTMAFQQTTERADGEAKATEAAVREAMEGEDVPWTCEAAISMAAGLSFVVAEKARYCDLVVLPKPYGSTVAGEAEAVLEAALFDGQVPVLVVPRGHQIDADLKRIVVAWNQSDEAFRAMRSALPLLKRAGDTTLLTVDPKSHGQGTADRGGELSRMLSRHGVNVTVSQVPNTLPRISDMILRHAQESGADLVVMGAYGHSRLRQAILGGATRNMLMETTVPVLMAR